MLTLMWGLGGIRQVCGEMLGEECSDVDTSVIFSPLPPPQWWPSPDITCVVVAELGRKCWWNFKWCWKAELEIEVMSAYPHGNNPAYIAIFYENAMCRISSKCNVVNIFSNVINITLIMSSKIYFACCKSHMIEIFRICIQLPFLLSLAISPLLTSYNICMTGV